MKSLTALALSALVGGSLLFGAAPALAVDAPPCPATMHSVDPATNFGANCAPNSVPTEPLASGNNWSIWSGTPPTVPGPPPVQPPPYKALPAPAAPELPGQVIQVPAGEARPGSVVAGGNRTGPNWTPVNNAPSGETLQSVTPISGQAAVEEPAAAAPAVVPPAAVLPATEVQAVEALRSATATPAEKEAATAVVTAKIAAVLDQALANAIGR